MKEFFLSLSAIVSVTLVGCRSDSVSGPRFSPEPPPSSTATFKIAYARDNRVVVKESGHDSITISIPPGGVNQPTWTGQPTWSPAGDRLAFGAISTAATTLFVWDPAAADLTQIVTLVPATTCSKGSCEVVDPPFSPAWSPDGTQLAFILRDQIQIAGGDGSAIRSVPSPQIAPVPGSLHWAPDGKTILFATDTAVLSIPTGGGAKFTTVVSGFDSNSIVNGFEVSPDGKKIAVSTSAALHIWDIATHTRVRVEADSYYPPAWSRDGARIAFTTSRLTYDPPTIYVLNRDGGSLHRITTETVIGPLAWLPDGTHIAYGAPELGIIDLDGGAKQVVAAGFVDFALSLK